jgi:hypothetical protein
MAKYLGLLTTDMRGKIGGIVASRGRSGTTLSAKGVPRLAPSAAQQQQRSIIANSLYKWRQLTSTQMLSWGGVAATQVWTNSLGSTFVPTGLQLWTQAYVNAAAIGTIPPATCGGSPSLIAPIGTVGLTLSGSYFTLTVYGVTSGYTGAWVGYLSRVIPSSVNYTKTIAKRLMGANGGGDFIYCQNPYVLAYGRLPPVLSTLAVRVVPIDPTYFYSGTVWNSQVQVYP